MFIFISLPIKKVDILLNMNIVFPFVICNPILLTIHISNIPSQITIPPLHSIQSSYSSSKYISSNNSILLSYNHSVSSYLTLLNPPFSPLQLSTSPTTPLQPCHHMITHKNDNARHSRQFSNHINLQAFQAIPDTDRL